MLLHTGHTLPLRSVPCCVLLAYRLRGVALVKVFCARAHSIHEAHSLAQICLFFIHHRAHLSCRVNIPDKRRVPFQVGILKGLLVDSSILQTPCPENGLGCLVCLLCVFQQASQDDDAAQKTLLSSNDACFSQVCQIGLMEYADPALPIMAQAGVASEA